jgi:hypothetical protein
MMPGSLLVSDLGTTPAALETAGYRPIVMSLAVNLHTLTKHVAVGLVFSQLLGKFLTMWLWQRDSLGDHLLAVKEAVPPSFAPVGSPLRQACSLNFHYHGHTLVAQQWETGLVCMAWCPRMGLAQKHHLGLLLEDG